ncbi:MAG: COX15/CtaA family protein [Actinomycetota bacterium]
MGSYRRLSILSTVATFLLIAIGGLVRATKSGLGCGDDWPACNGEIVPVLNGRPVIIEYSHRLAAAAVIVLVAALAVRAFKEHRDSRKIVRATTAALVLVLGQAVVGMLVVKLHLEALSVALHLGLALALLALLSYGAVAAAGADRRIEGVADASLARSARIGAGAIFLLMLVGSYVTGRDAGAVFPDWPLMNGRAVPDFGGAGSALAELSAIHFTHRVLAAVVGVIVAVVAWGFIRRRREFPAAARLAGAAVGLFALEVLIGALNVWTDLNEMLVFAHLVVGASIWTSLVAMALVTEPKLRDTSLERAVAPARVAVEGGR